MGYEVRDKESNMRGTRAKQFRKLAYGDRSIRDTKYLIVNQSGTIRCVGDRAEYQKMKKERRVI